jgi:hypothetical protein
MVSTTTITESKALELLGQGIDPGIVASAIGVSVSRISQLLADPEFLAKVTELRYLSLTKHAAIDSRYDNLEDKLLEKLENLLPFLVRPLEVSKVLSQINAAKRRGAVAAPSTLKTDEVVQLVMPIQIVQKFTVNQINQVIQAGQQELVTVQSGNMQKLLTQMKGAQNVQSLPGPVTSNEGTGKESAVSGSQ